MKKTIEIKMKSISALDDDILNEMAEDNLQEEMEIATLFEIEIGKELDKFKDILSKYKDPNSGTVKRLLSESHGGIGVKLPKIYIKQFTGDPIKWQQFEDTFDATITRNGSISEVEKFTYLRGYLSGEAEKCIEGITLTGDNFERAMTLLRERYGNPQLIISTRMDNLIKLEKNSGYRAPIKELRNIYDKIESHMRSLLTLGVDSEHFGPLLIPIIVNKLPNEIRLEISRKLGKDNWKIHQFMDTLKNEITARENCEYVNLTPPRCNKEFPIKFERRDKKITTQALLANNDREPKCCFCKRNHYHDKCTVVTDVESRKKDSLR